jgi:hypothetical protein
MPSKGEFGWRHPSWGRKITDLFYSVYDLLATVCSPHKVRNMYLRSRHSIHEVSSLFFLGRHKRHTIVLFVFDVLSLVNLVLSK